MLELFAEIGDRIVRGGFKTHLVVYILCSALGILILQWLFAKALFFAFCFVWFRATFPRYRYDQIMRLGWKVFIPITIVWILVAAWMVHLGWFKAGV